MHFKVSEKIKEELLKEIDIEKRLSRVFDGIEDDFDGKEELLEKLQGEAFGNLIKDVDNLKNNNILSDQLVRYCKSYTDESIELEDEQIDEIISNLSEDEKEFNSDIIKEIKNTKKVKLLYLSVLTNINSTDKKGEITLSEKMKEMLKVIDNTRSAQNDDDRTKRVEKALKNGKVEFRDYEYLTGEMGIRNENAINQEKNTFVYLYNEGIISEEKLYEYLGMEEFNTGVVDYIEEYSKKKEEKINDWTKSIKEKIENLPPDISDNAREQFKALLEKINDGSENEEKIIEEYNAIASEEWKNYLKSDNRMLFHETTSPLKGEFRDATMSTSLLENDHIYTYRNEWVGYKINPQKIVTARSKDAYVSNARRDKYAQNTEMIIDLPNNVSKKMKEEKTYSEVAVTDFTIESAVVLNPRNKEQLELAKKLAEAQNVPIDTFNGEKFLPIEEFYLDEKIDNITQNLSDIKNYKQEIIRLGLRDFTKEIEFNKEEIYKSIKFIEEHKKEYSREDMTKITDGIDLENINELIEKCNSQLNIDYQKLIDEKVKSMIKNSRIEQIDYQEQSLKNEKISFLEKIFGKDKLQKARLEALNLKKEEISVEEIIAEPNEKESISNLLSYIKQNGSNNEIDDFIKSYSELCNDDSIKKQIQEYTNERISEDDISNNKKDIITSKIPLFQIATEIKRQKNENNIQRENNKINMLKSTRQKSNFRDDIKINKSEGVKLLESFKEKIVREVNIGKETEKDKKEIGR